MSIISNNVPVYRNSAKYIYDVSITSGTVDFYFKVKPENESEITEFRLIKDGSFSADDNGVISLPDCDFKAVITGEAKVTLNYMSQRR